MRRAILASLAFMALALPRAYGWRAFNDFSWALGQSSNNVTLYTTGAGEGERPQGTNGYLLDYDSGQTTTVAIAVSGGSWSPDGQATNQGANAASGTDADKAFAGIVDCLGVISYSATNIEIRVTGLATTETYNLVLYSNRDGSYTNRDSEITLSDVDAFTNLSSAGAEFDGPTDDSTVVHSTNTLTGYIVRFANIDPGDDGDMLITVGWAFDTNKFYINALALENEVEAGTVLELSALPWTVALLGMVGACLLGSARRDRRRRKETHR